MVTDSHIPGVTVGTLFGGANLESPVGPAQTSLFPLRAKEDASPVGTPLGMFGPSGFVYKVRTAQQAMEWDLLDRLLLRDYVWLHAALVMLVITEVAQIDIRAIRVRLLSCQRHSGKEEG